MHEEVSWFSPSRQLSTIRPLAHSLPAPPHWDREKNWKKKVELVGWDTGSLIGQQRKRKIMPIILIKEYTKRVSSPFLQIMTEHMVG